MDNNGALCRTLPAPLAGARWEVVHGPQHTPSTWAIGPGWRAPIDDKLASYARNGIVRLPSRPERYGTRDELRAAIEAFIKRYISLPEYAVRIAAAFILLTWAADNFEAVPYLRFVGPPQSGKSRALNVVGALCYRATMLGASPTGATVFRTVDATRGTLLVDESDFTGKAADDLMAILRAGYQRNRPIARCTGNNYAEEFFDPFGPKMLAGTQPFNDEALDSRCLSFSMQPGSGGAATLHLPPEFADEALRLRNQLLRFRFDFMGDIHPDESIKGELTGRAAQLAATLLPFNPEPGFRRQLIAFFTKAAEEALSDSLEALVLEALQLCGAEPNVPLGAVATKVRMLAATRKCTAPTDKSVAATLRNLGFTVEKSNGRRVVRASQAIVTAQAQKYGVWNPPAAAGLPVVSTESLM